MTNENLIKVSSWEEYAMYQEGEYYVFREVENNNDLVRTPHGHVLKTSYSELADKILDDLDSFGPDYMGRESVLPWHYTMVENFSRMSHEKVEQVLNESFLTKKDWTLDTELEKKDNLKVLFDITDDKRNRIRVWLSKCTHMQMTAACCIGNAFHSLNIAYVLAEMMEKYDANEIDKHFNELSDAVALLTDDVPFDVRATFEVFYLYYGIHLKEDGNIITSNNTN